LFQVAERFGQRFGEEPPLQDGGLSPQDQQLQEQRSQEVNCALIVVQAIAADTTRPAEFRARALYLAGNLEFLRGDYKEAVKDYDLSLKLLPGVEPDAGDPIGRDAAHNRAIALRKAEEEDEHNKDAGPPDGGPPDGGEPPDGGGEQKPDAGAPQQKPDAGSGEQDGGAPRQEPDGGSQPPPEADGGAPQPEPKQAPENKASQDEAILDQLEQAPTVQQEDAKNRALKARRRGANMEDK